MKVSIHGERAPALRLGLEALTHPHSGEIRMSSEQNNSGGNAFGASRSIHQGTWSATIISNGHRLFADFSAL